MGITVDDALLQADKWHMPSLDAASLNVLADEVRRLRGLFGEPLRVIAVEAIREVTGCPDIRGTGDQLLTETLLRLAQEIVTTNV